MVIYMTLITLYYMPSYRSESKNLKTEKYSKDPLTIIRYYGVYIYAFSSLAGYHQSVKIIKRPTTSKSIKMAIFSTFFAFIFLLTFSLLAYFSLGDILKNKAY